MVAEYLKIHNEVVVEHGDNKSGTEFQDQEEGGGTSQGESYIHFGRRISHKGGSHSQILIVYRLVPSQDGLFALILWYVAKYIFKS